jgi:hypothetical protein
MTISIKLASRKLDAAMSCNPKYYKQESFCCLLSADHSHKLNIYG